MSDPLHDTNTAFQKVARQVAHRVATWGTVLNRATDVSQESVSALRREGAANATVLQGLMACYVDALNEIDRLRALLSAQGDREPAWTDLYGNASRYALHTADTREPVGWIGNLPLEAVVAE